MAVAVVTVGKGHSQCLLSVGTKSSGPHPLQAAQTCGLEFITELGWEKENIIIDQAIMLL